MNWYSLTKHSARERKERYPPPQALLPATSENTSAAKEFLMQKWKERAIEYGQPEPTDLSNACRFSSLFIQKIFGGTLRGNWHHQFVMLPDGRILDPTEAAGVDIQEAEKNPHLAIGFKGNVSTPYGHDPKFWYNSDHTKTLKSCLPRVEKWVSEFMASRR